MNVCCCVQRAWRSSPSLSHHLIAAVSAVGVRPRASLQACGSSGTTAGLALGAKLAGLAAEVRGYAVCDSPDYFYAEIDGLLQELGYTETGEPGAALCVCMRDCTVCMHAVCWASKIPGDCGQTGNVPSTRV